MINSPLFLDASALIALVAPRDQHHEKMSLFWEKSERVSSVTSNLVMAEFLTYFSRNGLLKESLEFQMEFLKHPLIQTAWVDQDLHNEACEVLKKFSDHKLSFTDATSFAIMKREKLTHALTFDDDFKRAGFEMVP